MSVPRLPDVILRYVLRLEREGASIRGDLHADFRTIARERGRAAAVRWYWHEVLKLGVALVWHHVTAGRPRLIGDRAGDGAVQDLRYAMRTFTKRPGFTALAVVTLALGIGPSTAIVGAVHDILLAPVPYPEPDRLVLVFGASERMGQRRDVISGRNFIDFKAASTTFSSLAAFKPGGAAVFDDAGRPVPTPGLLVSPDFLTVLGVSPLLGRAFEIADGQGQSQAVVISHGLWQRRFSGAPDIVGQRIELLDGPHEIVGVLPEAFDFAAPFDLLTPLDLDQFREASRMQIDYWLIGRLATGQTMESAGAELNEILAAAAVEDSRMEDWSMHVERFGSTLYEYIRAPLLLLLAAVILTLVIACANVANLFLTRGAGRQQEMAIRASLGASRARVVRQLVTEGVVLATAGGALGIIGAGWIVSVMPRLLPATVPIPGSAATVLVPSPGLSWPVLFVALVFTMIAAVVTSLAPGVQLTRTNLAGQLRLSTNRSTADRGVKRLQRGFVGTQLALSVFLVVSTTFALVSALRLLRVESGLDPRGVLSMYVGELNAKSDTERAAYLRQVIDAVQAVPGVVSAGINDYIPFQGEDDFEGISIEGRPEDRAHFRTEWRRVSAAYFDVVRIPLVRGRVFTEADDERAPSVVVLNRAMAEQYWPGEDPIGQRMLIHEDVYETAEVIGVVGDVRRRGLDQEAPPVFYVPFHRKPRPSVGLFVRSQGDPLGLAEPVKRAVWSVDPTQPIEQVEAFPAVLATSSAIPRAVVSLIGAVAALALLLTTIGVYGTMSYMVSQRVPEMSIRMALGARGVDVRNSILASSLRLIVPASITGLVLAAAGARLAAAALYEANPSQVWPYALGVGVVAMTAIAACAVPAGRAARLDPVRALRSD